MFSNLNEALISSAFFDQGRTIFKAATEELFSELHWMDSFKRNLGIEDQLRRSVWQQSGQQMTMR